ncbi:unnamed protein product [Rotaria sp. Silwood1]|nr:unnamed protein product [Rotaria sp. Silwood1]
MCTVVAMEFFITPALEIGEIMSNLMMELIFDDTDLIRKVSCDSNVMRYAIMTTAHHYPALQAIFREIYYTEGNKNLTQCSNFFHDTHVLEIQTFDIVESMKSESIIDGINRYVSNDNHHRSSISEINTCMAFGRGPRICKGKELAIRIITTFLATLYTELDQWPNVELSAGRKRIENSFRKKYADHKKTLGFYYWWINNDGDLVGITKDLSLYVYLCDTRHYPEYIDTVQLNPILPTHLPPQHAAVIKFVPNDYSFVDIDEDLRKRYPSIYHIEEMNGTRRMHSRHIRIDVYDKIEYNNILNSGTITLGGMLCEVDEYLPAPKILLCTKCNVPGHTKKVCRLEYERCRRCGNNRSNGDHKQCNILCHHCGGEHQANDYKSPILLEFRRNLIERLRENPNKLPPHIQMFIPIDCRLRKTEKVLFNENAKEYKKPVQQYTYSNSVYEWPMLDKPLKNYSYDKHLNNLQNELEAQKHKYQLEIEKINNKLLQYSTNIQKSCALMQTQINTQKEIIDSTASIVNGLTLNMNTNIINIINNLIQLLYDFTPHDQMKNNLSKLKDDLKEQHHYIGERQTAYNNYIQNLEKLWLRQSNSMTELLDLCSFITHNDK